MTRHGVSHLVVVDPVEQRPLGVLSTLDLAGVLAAAWSLPLDGRIRTFPRPIRGADADAAASQRTRLRARRKEIS